MIEEDFGIEENELIEEDELIMEDKVVKFETHDEDNNPELNASGLTTTNASTNDNCRNDRENEGINIFDNLFNICPTCQILQCTML